jgi:ATP-dependent DNA helicase RecQ
MHPDDVLVGHNLHRFDRPEIARRFPDSPLLELATLDTLELSVLAFPQRPYHRLAKDDLLVRDARPNPVSDVRASETILHDALAALTVLSADARALLCALLPRLQVEAHAVRGLKYLFQRLDWAWDATAPLDLAAAWTGTVCTRSLRLRDPVIDMPLLMVAAWLRAARHNDGSVLPTWVRRTWPTTPRIIQDLRGTACDHPSCDWCRTQLCPDYWLREVFGFDAYRPLPAAPDGGSLQRLLVSRGLRGEPSFGILPTGGGKSLCFQIPAEARHRLLGQLTVVISPLQSLMKDQVDSLKQRIPHARAIYGGLPSLLRPEVMNEVRTGLCGLLYLSPEQFRNAGILRLLAQRELGAIVFDEAHCLSQWGHDFRTDYPYVLRAVRELTQAQGAAMPPVFLFTATTQHDATQQIIAHAQEEAGRPIELYDGGSERSNLTYHVHPVPEHDRLDAIVQLLDDHLADGTAIIFCGSRARTEAAALDLTGRGFPAEAYHAGLEADTRRELQDAFLGGRYRIITATNAFGMGVDKPDVRLVVHLDMPSRSGPSGSRADSG